MRIRLLENQKGNAIVEFALATPVMMLMALDAADFGRLFVESAILASASSAGAVQGYRTTKDAIDAAAMEQSILSDIGGLDGVTAHAETFCDCPDNPGLEVACTTTTCPGYGFPRVYVKSTASKDFQTLGRYIGIPSDVDIDINSYLRVQ